MSASSGAQLLVELLEGWDDTVFANADEEGAALNECLSATRSRKTLGGELTF